MPPHFWAAALFSHFPFVQHFFDFVPNSEQNRYPRPPIPFIEDAAAIQIGLMKIVRSIESGALDHKQASLMLYALQIATMNLKRLEAAMSQTSAAAQEAREKSLAEELLARIDDEDFCKAVLADAPPLDSIPPPWGGLGSVDPKEPHGGNSSETPNESCSISTEDFVPGACGAGAEEYAFLAPPSREPISRREHGRGSSPRTL